MYSMYRFRQHWKDTDRFLKSVGSRPVEYTSFCASLVIRHTGYKFMPSFLLCSRTCSCTTRHITSHRRYIIQHLSQSSHSHRQHLYNSFLCKALWERKTLVTVRTDHTQIYSFTSATKRRRCRCFTMLNNRLLTAYRAAVTGDRLTPIDQSEIT